jgi:UDPglucose 6-dehydrogenase
MTVIGSRSRRTVERLRELYQPFGGEVRTFPSPAEAELVKCAHNLFNATKISFWNEMWTVSRLLGVELDRVSGTVARSAEGSINPEYGIKGGKPFAGACLPKDVRGFLGFATGLGADMPVLEAVVRTNDMLAAERNGHKEPVEIELRSA